MALKITSANSVYMLAIESVFPTPQQIQGFGVDEAFDTEAAAAAEVQLGVDGFAASGWTPRLTTQTITLLAASESFRIFEDWLAAMDQAREVLYATGIIEIPSIGRKYFLPQGTLTNFPAMPNAKRVLQQRQFTIVWAWPVTSSPI
jgi:hypothetical protein